MSIKKVIWCLPIIVLGIKQALCADSLSLSDAEKIALERAPEIDRLMHDQLSLENESISAAQLPDPKLQAGLLNLPTDTFSTTQENMTQYKFSLTQSFPKGRSLHHSSEKKKILAMKANESAELTQAEILRTLRMDWLELCYLYKAKQILENATSVFKHLIKVATSTLSVGKGNQHDVLRAQLELSQVESQLIAVRDEIRKTRANIARWLGSETMDHIKSFSLPNWPSPKGIENFIHDVNSHPAIKREESNVKAAEKDIELSKSLYMPAWSVGLHYSIRQGRSGMPRKQRADFFGVQLSTDLPIFPGSRQDRKVASSIANYGASKSQREEVILNLHRDVQINYSIWQQFNEQNSLYKEKLLKEAKQYAKATLIAYENNQLDFPTVARAHDRELKIALQSERIRANLFKARANLLYLESKRT